MSKTYNMVIVGNGSGFLATLHVTVTNGTATSVAASKNGQSVSFTYDGTNGWWEGNVTSTGTWTVTATDGTRDVTASVTISSISVRNVILALPGLPSGYTELQYIQSSGTQYIDTGVLLDGDIHIITTCLPQASGAKSGQFLFNKCYFDGYNTTRIIKYYSGVNLQAFDLSTEYSIDWYVSASNDYLIKINGVVYSGTKSMEGPYNIWLLADNYYVSSGDYLWIGRIKKTQIFTSALVREFYPAKRNSDSAIGMYDIVSETFFTNAGTGTFTAGPAV